MGTAISTADNNERFFVLVNREIVTPRGFTIRPGDQALIDPDAQPRKGSTVLVDDELVPWTGQQSVIGVVVKVAQVVTA